MAMDYIGFFSGIYCVTKEGAKYIATFAVITITERVVQRPLGVGAAVSMDFGWAFLAIDQQLTFHALLDQGGRWYEC